MGWHSDITPNAVLASGGHVLHFWTFTNTTTRDAGTDTLKGSVSFTAADVGRVARVGTSAPYDFYLLTNHVGPAWVQIGVGGGGSVSSVFGRTGAVVAVAGDYDDSEIALANQIGTPAVANVRDYLSRTMGPGGLSGGVLTRATASSIDVSAGSGFIRATNSDTAPVISFDWTGVSGLAMTLNALNYIYVEYNGGAPQVITTTLERSDLNTNILLGTVYRDSNDVHLTFRETRLDNFGRTASQRLLEVDGFVVYDGGIASHVGTRNLAITQGVGWLGLSRFVILSGGFNTSVSDTFVSYYRNGVGGWTSVAAQTQVSNSQYDDGSGTLASLSVNRYGVYWIYLAVDSDVYMVYGRGDYTLANALDAEVPGDLPPHLTENHAQLAARIIVQQGASSFYRVDSAFTTQFQGAGATDHGSLSGLADDDHTQYSLADGTRGVARSNVWRLQDNATPSKQVAIDASGIATSTTRTVTVPDFDCTISQARSIRETGGPTVLTLGAVVDGEYLVRSGSTIVGGTPAGGGLTIDYIDGFVADAGTPANRRGYTYGSDPLGTGSLTLVAVSCLTNNTFVAGGARAIFGTWNGTGGAAIVQDGGTIGYRYVDGSATLRSGDNFNANRVGKWAVYHMRVINTGGGTDITIQLFEDGAQLLEGYFVGAGGAPTAGGNLCTGLKGEGSVTPAFENGRLHGCGYVNSAMTIAEIAAHAQAIQEAGQLVQTPSGTALTSGWRVDDGATNPGTTWTAFIGANNLTALNSAALTRTVKAAPILWF